MNFENKPIGSVIMFLVDTIGAFIIPIIIGAAVIVFLWGVFTYIRSADNADDRKKGNEFMFYGIIGLFVMVCLWGLVRIFTGTFNIPFIIPQLKTSLDIVHNFLA